MFENYPAYLVPDTNCFVDHLDGLRAIVACQAFTLVVPLIGKTVLLQIVSNLCQLPPYSLGESDPEITFLLKLPLAPFEQIEKFYETGSICKRFPLKHSATEKFDVRKKKT